MNMCGHRCEHVWRECRVVHTRLQEESCHVFNSPSSPPFPPPQSNLLANKAGGGSTGVPARGQLAIRV